MDKLYVSAVTTASKLRGSLCLEGHPRLQRSYKTLRILARTLTNIPQSLLEVDELELLIIGTYDYESGTTCLPDWITQLRTLLVLNVAQNRLTALPMRIGELSRLTYLDVSENRLTSLPAEIGLLYQLTQLEAQNNQLTSIPAEIMKLSRLERVNFRENQITILPAEICQLKLAEVSIKASGARNPLKIPPKEIVRQGFDAITEYYKEFKKKSVTIGRQKLLILGNTEMGKTSLARTLIKGASSLTPAADRTKVIEQTIWLVDEELQIQVNDFGGHPIYNLTHKFFLSSQSDIIIAYKVTEMSECTFHNLVGRWIDHIWLYAPGTSIRVVGTHADLIHGEKLAAVRDRVKCYCQSLIREHTRLLKKGTQTVDMKLSRGDNERFKGAYIQSKTRYQDLLTQLKSARVHYYAVSSENAIGMNDLKQGILESAREKTFGLPDSWYNVIKHVTQKQDNGHKFWMTKNDVIQIMSDLKVSSPQETTVMLLKFMYRVGDILWYQHNSHLEEYVFHDPPRIIEILKYLLSHDLAESLQYGEDGSSVLLPDEFKLTKKMFLDQGMLSRRLVHHVWSKFVVEDDSLDVLLKLIINFHLCFEATSKRHTKALDNQFYQFPFFLTSDPPKVLVTRSTARICPPEWKLVVQYQFKNGLPLNFFETCSVLLQSHLLVPGDKRRDWKGFVRANKSGVEIFLHYRNAGQNDSIVLTLLGSKIPMMLQLLLSIHLGHIHYMESECPGLVCEVQIACPRCLVVSDGEPYMFNGLLMESECPMDLEEVDCERCSGNRVQGAPAWIPAILVYPIRDFTDHRYRSHVSGLNTFLEEMKKKRDTNQGGKVEFSHTTINEAMLMDLAAFLANRSEISDLGLKLGIPYPSIRCALTDNERDIRMAAFNVLLLWFENTALDKNKTRDDLSEALEKSGRLDILMSFPHVFPATDSV